MPPRTPRTGTRSSSRLASKTSPESAQSASEKKAIAAENDDSEKKRKADAIASPSDRPGKKTKPDQKTLEETITNGTGNAQAPESEHASGAASNEKPDKGPSSSAEGPTDNGPQASITHDQPENETAAREPATQSNGDPAGAVIESSEREKAQPSNVLEKGIFYFFSRPRVGIEDPKSVQDIARSYLVLRPLPASAKLGHGPLDDLKNNRLIALPKKTLPKSHSDRFMAFVEKQGVTIETLKQDFMASATYQTQTLGERTTPPVTPMAEGVYAITTTGRESHLAYMLTIPAEPGPVQATLGLAAKGSFVLSTKNPAGKGPANAQLDQPAAFSQEIMDDFRGRNWMPLEPRHLDFDHCQMLLIGEAQGELGKAVEVPEQDEKSPGKMEPEEEMELLEDEDLKRAQALRGDDTIFDDLGVSKKDYPQVPTTW